MTGPPHTRLALRPCTRTHLAVLSCLLASSASSLRILDLHEAPCIAAREILGVHAPYLRSLRLVHFSLDSAAFLRQCTRLEEFVTSTASPLPSPLHHNSHPWSSIWPLTNVHLQERALSYSRCYSGPIQIVIITSDNNSEDLREFAMLKTRCAEKGVEVVLSEVPSSVVSHGVSKNEASGN